MAVAIQKQFTWPVHLDNDNGIWIEYGMKSDSMKNKKNSIENQIDIFAANNGKY